MAATSIFDVLVKFSGNSAEAVDAVKKVSKAEREAATARKAQVAEQKKAWDTLKTSTVDLVKIIRNASLAIGGAMLAIAKSAANYGDEMLAMSEKTGISVENLSRLGYAAKIGETSLEGLTGGLALLSRKMADAADGNKAAAKTFTDIGISIKNADGSLRPAIEVMLDFSEVAKNSNDSTRLTAQAMELFGKRGAELIPFLKQGKVGINELMKEADRLGITLDEKTARGGDAFNQSLDKLNGALQGVRNTIGKEILPILTKYVSQLTEWIAANKEIIAQKISDFFKGFIETVKNLVEFFAKWKIVILSVVAALIALSAAAKISATITAVKTLIPVFSSIASKIGLSGGMLAKFGIAGIATAAAIWGINKAFDYLNKQLDEAEKRTASLVKTQKKQEDVLAAVSKGLGREAWGQLIKDLDLVGKSSTERFGALQQWAVQNKATNKEAAQVWNLLNTEIGKNKEKIENSNKALKTIPPVVKKISQETEIYKALLDDIQKYTIKALNADFEAHKRILAEVQAGTIQLSDEGVKKLKDEYAELGAQLGKLDDTDFLNYINTFIETQPKFKEITVDPLTNGLLEQSDLFADIADGAAGVADEILRWTPGIARALGALGLMNDDMAALLSGVEGMATGIGKIATGDLTGIFDALASLPDLLDGLFESTQEGYVKQLGKQGFNDEYSQELLDKMSEVSDAMGDKSYGIKAYIEDFFKETNIDNAEEFSRMSDLLNESIGEYIAQGHTADEAYEKYGDELAQLTDAQEKYGFETTESLSTMIAIQRQQTKAGKVAGLTDVVGGIEKMISGMAGQNYSQGSWTSVFGMFQDAFKQLQGQGLSMSEIQAIIGPTMEKALKIAEEQGIDTSSIQQLKDFYAKMSGAGGLLDVISGLNTAVTGLAETGSLTQENINQAAITAQETYDKLIAQGFTQNEALAQIGPTLGEISKSAEQYGYTIPEGIAELTTQAEAMNLTGEKPLDETISDGLVAGFDRVVEVMKGFYDSVPRFARGGFVEQAEGEEGIARIHGGEYVLAADAVRRAGQNAIETVNSTGLMPTKYVPVFQPMETQQLTNEIRRTSEDLKNQQAAFLAGFGNTIGKSLKEGIAAAMPGPGKTEVNANVALNGNSILRFLQTAMNNGSLVINANAVRVQ